MTSKKKNADNMQVKRLVKTVHVKYGPGPRNTIEEAGIAVGAVHGFLSDFLRLTDEDSVVDDECVEYSPLYNHDDLVTMDDLGPSV